MGVGYLTGQGGGGSNIKSIQSGITTISSASTIKSITISSVNIAKSIVVVTSGERLDGGAVDGLCHNVGYLVDSTTLVVERGATGADAQGISWQVIEFNNVKSLQSGERSVSSSGTTDIPVSSYSPGKSMLIFSSKRLTTTTTPYQYAIKKLDSSNLQIQGYLGGAVFYVRWQLIEFN